MTEEIVNDGLDWYRDKGLGNRTNEAIDTIKVGTGTNAPSSTDSSMQNEVHTSDTSNGNVTIKSTGSVGEYRAQISVSGGGEVPAGTDISEFGVFTNTDVMIKHEVRSAVTIESGDRKTFETIINLADT